MMRYLLFLMLMVPAIPASAEFKKVYTSQQAKGYEMYDFIAKARDKGVVLQTWLTAQLNPDEIVNGYVLVLDERPEGSPLPMDYTKAIKIQVVLFTIENNRRARSVENLEQAVSLIDQLLDGK